MRGALDHTARGAGHADGRRVIGRMLFSPPRSSPGPSSARGMAPDSRAGETGTIRVSTSARTRTGRAAGFTSSFAVRPSLGSGARRPVGEPLVPGAAPSGRYLYAVNELRTFEGAGTERSARFRDRFCATGRLALLNQRPSKVTDPCHLAVDACWPKRPRLRRRTSRDGGAPPRARPMAASCRPGQSAVSPGPVQSKARQEGPHAHMVLPDGAARFVLWAATWGRIASLHLTGSTAFWPGSQPNHRTGSGSSPALGTRHMVRNRALRALYLLEASWGAPPCRSCISTRVAGALESLSSCVGDWGWCSKHRGGYLLCLPNGRFLSHLESWRRRHRRLHD